MKINKFIITISVLAFLLSILNLVENRSKLELVYIDLNKAYSNYDYTIEMNKVLDKAKLKRKQTLDSIAYIIEYNRGSDKLSKEYIQQLEGQYISKQSYFESRSKEESNNYYHLIWDQINERIKEFAQSQNFDLILGANGSGALMYGEERIDKTDDFIQYVNSKYNGAE